MLEPNEEEETEGSVGEGGQNSQLGGVAEGGIPSVGNNRGIPLLLTPVT